MSGLKAVFVFISRMWGLYSGATHGHPAMNPFVFGVLVFLAITALSSLFLLAQAAWRHWGFQVIHKVEEPRDEPEIVPPDPEAARTLKNYRRGLQ